MQRLLKQGRYRYSDSEKDSSWHFTFCRQRHDLHVWYHNALSFLSLQCREKKEKESEPKLWLTDQIQSAAIH